MLSMIPILAGIIVGYIYALVVGVVDFKPVLEAKWFEMPEFIIPFVSYKVKFTWDLVLLMVPVAIVTLSEHIGHQLVLSKVVGRDYIEEPGLHRSILGDGTATMISALIGGPPKTTYGENIGVLAITRIYSVYVIAGLCNLRDHLWLYWKNNCSNQHHSNSGYGRSFNPSFRNYSFLWFTYASG